MMVITGMSCVPSGAYNDCHHPCDDDDNDHDDDGEDDDDFDGKHVALSACL